MSFLLGQWLTGWWQLKYFLFSSLLGEMIQFETTNQLNFELFGLEYLVGKIKFQGSIG